MADTSWVTESREELFGAAEQDIIAIDVLTKDIVYPPDQKYELICFHATQAVEKFLKGFIISKGFKVEKIHNLKRLSKEAFTIDSSVDQIAGYIIALDKYTPAIKYGGDKSITKNNINTVLMAVNTIANFPLIKSLRDEINETNKYKIVTELSTAEAQECQAPRVD